LEVKIIQEPLRLNILLLAEAVQEEEILVVAVVLDNKEQPLGF
jgi:hypothetical protein